MGWLTDGLRSTLSFGMQGVENEIENTEVVGRNYPRPGEYTLSSAATKQSMNQNRLRVITGGFFAQNMFDQLISNKLKPQLGLINYFKTVIPG